MKLPHASIVARASCYFLAILFTEFGKAFVDVGAAKLRDYIWADWLVLWVPTLGECLITMTAYFDRSFGQHMQNGGGPDKPLLTAEDFHSLMQDWQSKQPVATPTPQPPKPITP